MYNDAMLGEPCRIFDEVKKKEIRSKNLLSVNYEMILKHQYASSRLCVKNLVIGDKIEK